MRDIRVAISVLALAVSLGGCVAGGTDAGPVTSVLPKAPEMAADAERRGDWEAAARHWGQVVEADAANRDARLALARSLRLSGRCGPAAGAIAPLVTAGTDAEALVESAKCHLVSGRPEGAVAQLRAALDLAPESWEAETTLGVTLDRIGRHAEALAHHDRALELVPDKAIVLSNRSLSLALAGRLPEALVLMRQAAAMPTAPSRVRLNLAVLEALSGQGDRALTIASQEVMDDKADKLRLLRRVADAASPTEVKKP
ncbi:MAG: tetratricopeptide repeat protein [Pseudomonadota bacterium]